MGSRLVRLDSSKKAFLESMINAAFGVEGFGESVLVQAGEDRIRLTTNETLEVASRMRGVQAVGLYVAKIRGADVVLSIEGSQLLCRSITRNKIELDEDGARLWMTGSPIKLKHPSAARYVVASYEGFCLGCGRVSADGKVYPQVPKWRRLPLE